MNWLIFVFLQLFTCWQPTAGSRILAFFPMPWRSHHFVYKPLMKQLANRGHQVDYVTPLPMKDPPAGLNQLVIKDWQDEAWNEFDDERLSEATPFNIQRAVTELCGVILEKTFEHDQVSRNLLESNDTYDLIITESPIGNEPAVYFAHKFKALSVAIVGFPDYPWANELAGLPDNPSYMVNQLIPALDKMSFRERLYNTYTTVSIVLAGYYDLYTVQQARADKIMRYDGWEGRPNLMNMIGETALMLTNSHPSTGFPYPKAPHVKEISGMHIDSASQPLPKDLQDFMDDAPHGVIYFSLGSVLDPAEMLKDGVFDICMAVFKRLKQKVIWKVSGDIPEVKDPSIQLGRWYPQQGILAHKNLKMFITHGGLQSTVEAIAFGVPCLGIPFLFDQKKDVAFMENVGMAIPMKLGDITEKTLSHAINELLYNPKYREHAMKQKAMFEDRPRKPVEEATYWIEYVLRHGSILRPASATMPFYQVYLLDVIATVIVAMVAFFWVVKRTLRVVWAMFRSSETVPLRKKLN